MWDLFSASICVYDFVWLEFALTSAAVHWSCITAHLYEGEISIGVIAVAQACCEPGLQSSTEQQRSYFALTSAAVHWSCITAHLYEEQTSIGVIAVAQAVAEASSSFAEPSSGLLCKQTLLQLC